MTIDGINIFTEYGATVSGDSFQNVVSYPSLKEPQKNDWAEEQGIEVDLAEPRLNKKNVNLNVICDKDKFDDFISYLVNKTYRVYTIDEIGYTFKFRFLGISNYETIGLRSRFELKLVDDYPLYNYIPQEANLSATDYECSIDAVNIKNYGINLLDGTYKSLEGYSEIKERLEIGNSITQGVKVYETIQKFKEYDAVLKCYMRQNIADFWKGYNRFLYDLTQPNLRTLVANENSYEFYYKSSKVNFFYVIKGMIFCEFEIQIVVV